MIVNLSPLGGAGWQFFDDSGVPLTGGKLYTYAAGTTTPQTTYTQPTGTPIPSHTNPIILDSYGRVPAGGEIWLSNGVAYKFLLKTSADVQIWSADNISGSNNVTSVQNFTGTGAQIIFTLTNAPANENATQIYINGVYQQKNTYSLAGAVITFSEAPPITSSIEVNYI